MALHNYPHRISGCVGLRTASAVVLAAAAGCTALSRNDLARIDLGNSRDAALQTLHRDSQWSGARRQQLDQLFERVVAAERSDDAVTWLRVYVLAQVADQQDRAAQDEIARHFSDRLARLAAEPSPGSAVFASDLASLKQEVQALHELYSTPLADAAARPRE